MKFELTQFDRLTSFNRAINNQIISLRHGEVLTLTNHEPRGPYDFPRHTCMVAGMSFVASLSSDLPEYWHIQKHDNPTGVESLDRYQWYKITVNEYPYYMAKLDPPHFAVFWWEPCAGSPRSTQIQADDLYGAFVHICLRHPHSRIAKELKNADNT